MRFPPLREGNLRRGAIVNSARAIGMILPAVGKGEPPFAPTPPPDKGTSVRHRIAAARAIFPSASVNGWARLFALTPLVPLSREAGEGDYGVRKRSFRPR